MKPVLLILMGMSLCGCEMYLVQNADWGKRLFPPDPKNTSSAPNEPINRPVATGAKANAGNSQAQYDLAVSCQLGKGKGGMMWQPTSGILSQLGAAVRGGN